MPGLPPLTGQSPLVMQASALPLLQVSQRQRLVVYPASVQRGLAAVTLTGLIPRRARDGALAGPASAAGFGGQSEAHVPEEAGTHDRAGLGGPRTDRCRIVCVQSRSRMLEVLPVTWTFETKQRTSIVELRSPRRWYPSPDHHWFRMQVGIPPADDGNGALRRRDAGAGDTGAGAESLSSEHGTQASSQR